MDSDKNKETDNLSESDDATDLKCPKCKKELIARDLRKSSSGGSILKTRMVFFQGGKTILGKCGGCGELVGLPYKLVKDDSHASISEEAKE